MKKQNSTNTLKDWYKSLTDSQKTDLRLEFIDKFKKDFNYFYKLINGKVQKVDLKILFFFSEKSKKPMESLFKDRVA